MDGWALCQSYGTMWQKLYTTTGGKLWFSQESNAGMLLT